MTGALTKYHKQYNEKLSHIYVLRTYRGFPAVQWLRFCAYNAGEMGFPSLVGN